MVKRNAGRGRSTTRSQNKAVSDPVEQRSPNDRSTGGYDPEDYHAERPVPVGNAPIHSSTPVAEGIPTGITAPDGLTGIPRSVQSTFTAATQRDVASQQREGDMDHNAQMQECLENCKECHAICTETAQHCLHMGGKHAEAAHIRLLLDCADICQTSTDFMLRGSPQHVLTCGACAEVCLACAESCERIGQQDSMMKKCADICRRCAESCRQMAQMKAAA